MPSPNQELDKVSRAAVTLIRLSGLVHGVCSEINITPHQYRFLHLAANEPLRASIMAEKLRVGRPAVSKINASLEERRWTKRRMSTTDRRGVEIIVTAAGRRVMERTQARIAALILELVGPDEIDEFIAAILSTEPVMDLSLELITSHPREASKYMLGRSRTLRE